MAALCVSRRVLACRPKGNPRRRRPPPSEQPPPGAGAEGRPRRRSTRCPARSSILRRRGSLSGYSTSPCPSRSPPVRWLKSGTCSPPFPPHLRLDCVLYFSLAWPVATTAVCSAAILLWFYSSILLFFEQIYAYRRSRQDPGCYTLSSKFWTVGNSLEMKCKVQNQHPSTYKQAAKHLARSI